MNAITSRYARGKSAIPSAGRYSLLALYFAAGSAAEFNLLTIWHSLPHFFDYMAETIPPLSAGNLFADVQTKGSLAWWGYRLPIQLPLIWETLQLALASTLVAVAIATIFAFLAANNAWTPSAGTLCHSGTGGVFCAPCPSWRGR